MRQASLPAVVVMLVMALPANASESRDQASLTLRVISTPDREVLRDQPPKGLGRGEASKGDVVSGTTILRNAVAQFDKPKGAVVGRDRYVLTFTSPTRALIKVEAKLPEVPSERRGVLLSSRPRSRSRSRAGQETLRVLVGRPRRAHCQVGTR